MSWSDATGRGRPAPSRRALLAGLALSACGFTPVYAPGGPAGELSGRIRLDPPRDEAGYLLVRHFEERMGRAGPGAPYRVAARIGIDEEGLGITAARDITRFRLVGTLEYALSDARSGSVLQQGRITDFTGYSAPVFNARRETIAGNPVTIRAAERDATERLMTMLADRLVARLLATSADWRR